MTAFDEFIEKQIGKIYASSRDCKKIQELMKANEEKQEALKTEITPAQNCLIIDFIDNEREIGTLREIECYRQGFFDAILAISKRF